MLLRSISPTVQYLRIHTKTSKQFTGPFSPFPVPRPQLQVPLRSVSQMSTTSSASSDHPVLSRLLASNAQWSRDVTTTDPTFFKTLAKGQSPKVLWIGCADSRVPESVLLACKPGDVFVHRNIANQFHLHDDSALSALTYAVDVVGVEHVVVVGHTSCGGAIACLQGAREMHRGKSSSPQTPLQRWLTPLTTLVASLDVSNEKVPDEQALPTIVEENVRMQFDNVIRTDIIQKAWATGKPVHVHGWVYLVEEGRLKDLMISQGPNEGV